MAALEGGLNLEFLIDNFDFDKSEDQDKQGFVLEGGSGAGKTFDVLQFIMYYCEKNRDKGKDILIFRKTYADLKKTVLKDFIKILKKHNLYDKKHHVRSHPQSYNLFGNTIHFTGLDGAGSHGERHDIIYGNEAMEMALGDFQQLNQRCNEAFFLDYNPCFTKHWIYDKVIPRDDTLFLKSTQLDNPFLPKGQRKEILAYEPTHPDDRQLLKEDRRPHPTNIENGTSDDYMWDVYGLGERAAQKGTIYTNWKITTEYPEDDPVLCYWMDFGFSNDPTAIGEMKKYRGQIWVKEYIYEKGLTNVINKDNPQQLSIEQRLIDKGIPKNIPIIADSAEAKSIREIRLAGWDVRLVKKKPGSVNQGITKVKKWIVNIHCKSENIINERDNYKWVESKEEGEYKNIPIDAFNHHLDGIRYGVEYFNKQGIL